MERRARTAIWCAAMICALSDTGMPAHAERLARSRSLAQEEREAMMHEAVREAALSAALRQLAAPETMPAAQGHGTETPPLWSQGPQVKMVVDGVEVILHEPIQLHDDQPLIPLREAAATLYYGFVSLGGGAFRLVSPEGLTSTVRVAAVNQQPVVTVSELSAYFSVKAFFDASSNIVYVQGPSSAPFQTTLIEKPQEELAQEAATQALAKQVEEASQAFESVPNAARPALQLRGQVAYAYANPHVGSISRTVVSSVSGKALDFDVLGETVRKDIDGVFTHDYTYLNLAKPDLKIGLFDQSTDLDPLRVQTQAFNGLKVKKLWGDARHTTTIAGGTMENTVSGTSGSVKYLGRFYEAREEFFPVTWLGLQEGLIYTEHDADLPELSGTSRFPEHNVVSFSGANLSLPQDLTFSGHMARAIYTPDDEPDTLIGDWDWRTGLALNKERSHFGVAYEWVGDRYASFGDPASYQDYAGWDLSGDHRLTDRWSLMGQTRFYRNNVDDLSDRLTLTNRTWSLLSNYRLTDTQSVNLSVSRFMADPSGPLPGSESDTKLYRADYFFPFLFGTRFLASYQYLRSDPTLDTDASHTVGSSLFGSYGNKGSSWYLNHQLTKNFHEIDGENLNWSTTFNLDHLLTPDISTYLSSTYTRDQTDQTKTLHTLSGSSGLRMRLWDETDLRVEYSINPYDLNTERWRWPRDWSIFFYVSRALYVSTPPAFGAVEGWVFEDANANGRHDLDEAGVEGAVVRLSSAREATTDVRGHFRISRAVPGTQELQVDLANVSPEWTVQEPTRPLEVKRRKTSQVSFLLIRASSIRGRVFIDDTGDGIFQEHEEPLDGIAVILLPGDQFRRTNEEGLFSFEHLLPGRYTVQPYAEDVPQGYELVSDRAVQVSTVAGEDVRDVNFAVRLLVPGPTNASD